MLMCGARLRRLLLLADAHKTCALFVVDYEPPRRREPFRPRSLESVRALRPWISIELMPQSLAAIKEVWSSRRQSSNRL